MAVSDLPGSSGDDRVAALEEAIEGILRAARAGDWEGPELPPSVGTAIAHARVIRDLERQRRGLPLYVGTDRRL